MKPGKEKIKWLFLSPFFFLTIMLLLFSFDESREMVLKFLTQSYYFVQDNIVAILTAFFLVKGKFVINLFLRKILLLSATGLGKRYMIERVLNHEIKVHFLDHLEDDFKRLLLHVKHNFQEFPLVKKVMTVFAFLGSLSFVGKFMGGVLAVKVFIAKIWSFLLAVFLKVFSVLFYFVTKIIWGSWLSPIVEVVIFSWFLDWLEKIPFLKGFFAKIMDLFHYLFSWVEKLIAKLMKAPLRRFLKWMVKTMKIAIYTFIGYERVSLYQRLKQNRAMHPNSYEQVKQFRKTRVSPRRTHQNARERLKKKREKQKVLKKTYFS